jgi:hypothetical protein
VTRIELCKFGTTSSAEVAYGNCASMRGPSCRVYTGIWYDHKKHDHPPSEDIMYLLCSAYGSRSMKTIRSHPTAFRFDPAVKSSLALIAERDGRSMANMLEWLIRQHCEREGLGWPAGIAGSIKTADAAALSRSSGVDKKKKQEGME